jgi:hypothetical protein
MSEVSLYRRQRSRGIGPHLMQACRHSMHLSLFDPGAPSADILRPLTQACYQSIHISLFDASVSSVHGARLALCSALLLAQATARLSRAPRPVHLIPTLYRRRGAAAWRAEVGREGGVKNALGRSEWDGSPSLVLSASSDPNVYEP